MEAPEKIYLEKVYPDNGVLPNGLNYNQSLNDIEYIRTDAFVEKALKWYCLDCECNDNCKANHNCFFRDMFKLFLEGNDHALPPKVTSSIKPDGTTEENYRYRHFIRKMQDAFIKKACDFFEENIEEEDCKIGSSEWTELRAEYKPLDSFIRAFVEYMKGE